MLGPEAQALPRDQQLPPLLIINLQLPWYPVRFALCLCRSIVCLCGAAGAQGSIRLRGRV